MGAERSPRERKVSAEAQARVGETIGGAYRLTGVLGEGGFGCVYEAVELATDKGVAVKCLHPELAKHGDTLNRFRREAVAATRIGHPGIITVYDSGQDDDGTAWIAMERLEGEDARDAASAGPFTVGRAARITGQICDALQAAHDAGIVHRDLKLDNVWLGPRDRVTLLDFGVSKFQQLALDEARDGDGQGETLLTRTGVAIGSPYSMAPEQAQGKKSVDHRADVYAVGVLLFRMLTGQHPFEDTSYPMLVVKICTEPTPDIARFRADVPLPFIRIVERCLRKAPEERYHSCAEVAEAVAPFAEVESAPRLLDAPRLAEQSASALGPTVAVDSLTGQPLREGLGEEAERAGASVASSRRWVFPVAVAVLVALVVGVIAFAASRPPEDTGPREPPRAALPHPVDPIVRPMSVPPAGELGWRWVNPQPRAMPSWDDVEVAGPGLVAMVGRGGQAARLNGANLTLWPTNTTADLHGVAFLGPAQAIAVGDGGVGLALLQGRVVALETGTEADLRDVASLGTIDAVVVGDDGTIIRFRALRPQPIDTGRGEDLLGVAQRGEAFFVVGQRGVILRVDDEVVTVEREPQGSTLRAVGGCADTLYAVGDNGTVLRRVEAALEGEAPSVRWRRVSVHASEGWTGITCDGDHAAVSGRRGTVLLLSGDSSVRLESGSEQAFNGISSAPEARAVIVGEAGRLATIDRDHLVLLSDGPTGSLFDVTSLGGAIVAVGQWGRIARWDGRRLAVADSPTDAALSAMTALAEDRLIAVGDHGTLVVIRWDAADRVEDAPDGASWRDVVASDGALLAVGSGGAILRGTIGALVVARASTEGTLWAVAGTPSDAIAAGDDGVVFQVSQTSATPLDCPAGPTLRGAFRSEQGHTWLVGDEGRVLRVADGVCEEMRPAATDAPTLWAVEVGPNGRVMAVGSRGAAIERVEDLDDEDEPVGWTDLELDAAGLELRSIHRTDREVFVSGTGGAILRHPRLDR